MSDHITEKQKAALRAWLLRTKKFLQAPAGSAEELVTLDALVNEFVLMSDAMEGDE